MLVMPKLKPTRHPHQRIAFYGPMCSGKTWCADYLVDDKLYTKVSFAAYLKEMAYSLYGIENKDGDNRRVLQELGQDIRKHDSDVWVKHLLYRIDSLGKDALVVLDDLRYTNEETILKDNGFETVFVFCPESLRQSRIASAYPDLEPDVHQHASEQEWALMHPDYAVTSGGYETIYEIENKIFGT